MGLGVAVCCSSNSNMFVSIDVGWLVGWFGLVWFGWLVGWLVGWFWSKLEAWYFALAWGGAVQPEPSPPGTHPNELLHSSSWSSVPLYQWSSWN